jgi:hypothetical protein
MESFERDKTNVGVRVKELNPRPRVSIIYQILAGGAKYSQSPRR